MFCGIAGVETRIRRQDVKRPILVFAASMFICGVRAAEYPDMVGVWAGSVRIVSSGSQVSDQVARGGALIQDTELTVTFNYQDREAFMGESLSSAADAQPVPVWGAIRSTGREGVFVTGNGGRGNIWFTSPDEFEFCFANQTPEQMSSYCAKLKKTAP